MNFKGCYTALVTPMDAKMNIDYESLKKIVEFQVKENISGVLATGTTGESPTLKWEEHLLVIKSIFDSVKGRCPVIAGTGSNNTDEAIEATNKSKDIGVNAVLLVDPYYNGPSSQEIRKEYIMPIAEKFQDVQIIPYIIPGRTGTQLHPQDLAILHKEVVNVNSVKEATGNLENAKLIRNLCGKDFSILSGDDDKTFNLMSNPDIKASGVISVVSNIAPKAVQSMVQAILDGNKKKANDLASKLGPLFEMVTIQTTENTSFGEVICKTRNPLPYKTLMNIVGIPVGSCRQPLGKMTKKGLNIVLEKGRLIYEESPEILTPIEKFFDVNLQERLYNSKYWQDLTYETY